MTSSLTSTCGAVSLVEATQLTQARNKGVLAYRSVSASNEVVQVTQSSSKAPWLVWHGKLTEVTFWCGGAMSHSHELHELQIPWRPHWWMRKPKFLLLPSIWSSFCLCCWIAFMPSELHICISFLNISQDVASVPTWKLISSCHNITCLFMNNLTDGIQSHLTLGTNRQMADLSSSQADV